MRGSGRLVAIVLGLVIVVLVAVAMLLPAEKSRLLLDYVRVLAWPSVVVSLGVLFRSSIARLANRVRSAEIPGGKLEFFEQLTEAVKAVEDAASEVQDTAVDTRYSVTIGDGKPDNQNDDLRAFGLDLRELRSTADGYVSYRALSERTHYSRAILANAASGKYLPSLVITLAYVEACGGDTSAWEKRWRQLADKLGR